MSVAIAEIGSRCQACGSLLDRLPAPDTRFVQFGPLTLDLERRTTRVGDVVDVFARAGPGDTQWPLLVLLARAGGAVVTLDRQAKEILRCGLGSAEVRALARVRLRLKPRLARLGLRLVTVFGVGTALEVLS